MLPPTASGNVTGAVSVAPACTVSALHTAPTTPFVVGWFTAGAMTAAIAAVGTPALQLAALFQAVEAVPVHVVWPIRFGVRRTTRSVTRTEDGILGMERTSRERRFPPAPACKGRWLSGKALAFYEDRAPPRRPGAGRGIARAAVAPARRGTAASDRRRSPSPERRSSSRDVPRCRVS